MTNFKIHQDNILQHNVYELENGLNYYKIQFIKKNGTYTKMVFVISSLKELNELAEDPKWCAPFGYIYNPYPNVFIGVDNYDRKGIMIESKSLKFILAWLHGDVVTPFNYDYEILP